MAQPLGPIDVGGDLVAIASDEQEGMNYSLVFYPDSANENLRNEGKPMCFYYVPGRVRLAKEPNNDFMFHFQEFAGVMDQDTNVGVWGNYEIAGGLVTFSTTMEIPPAVFKKLTEQFTQKLKTQYANHPLLLWKSNLPPPNFSPVSLNSCDTKMDSQNFAGVMAVGGTPAIPGGNTTFDIQGNGKGNLSSTGLDSYSAMLGLIPAACIKDSLLSGHSTLVVRNEFKYWVKSLGFHIKIHGDWSQVYDHFSSAAEAHYFTISAKFEQSYDSLKLSGAIKVEIEDNPLLIGKEGQDKIQQTKELVLKMFFEKCQDVIFEKVPLEQPAKVESKGGVGGFLGSLFGFGGGASFKMKNVKKTGSMDYDETYRTILEKTTTATGNLEGIFHELEASGNNKDTIRKYFSKVNIGSFAEKIHVYATANAYWFTPDGKPGDPIKNITIQVGYKEQGDGSFKIKNTGRFKENLGSPLSEKNEIGAIWESSVKDRLYVFDFLKNKGLSENEQNQIQVTRTISYKEDPRVLKGLNEITEVILTDDHSLEVRAESAGKFGVLFSLENSENIIDKKNIKVNLTCKMEGFEEQKYVFDGKNADKPYLWELWFKTFEEIKPWSYTVEVRVTGKKITDKVISWHQDSGQLIEKGSLLNYLIPFPPVPDDLSAKVDEYLS